MSAANVGKRCRWVTYPKAKVGEHEGEIAAFVPAGASLFAIATMGGRCSKDVVRFDRYLVCEDKPRSCRQWYAPRVSSVEVLP